MTLPIFPTLKGLTFPARRAPLWKTLHQEAVSGHDNPIPLWTFPRWAYELAYDFLRSDGVNLEWQALAAFFNQVQGSALVFQFTDPDDGTVTNQGFGVGNGTTTAFPLVRTMAGAGGLSFVEPVFAPTAMTITINGVLPPFAPTLGQTAGGSIAATTYFVKTTWQTSGQETMASNEVSLAVGANNLLTVAPTGTPPVGAVLMNVYVSTTTQAEKFQGSVTAGLTWTEPTSGLLTNTVVWPFVTLGTQGLVTFSTAPQVGTVVGWTGAFNWLCRFDDDAADFEKFMNQFWRLGKIKFTTIKTQSK